VSPESIMVSFAVIGALVLLVCCWPTGPRVPVESDAEVYTESDSGAETTCADLNDGRPCVVCAPRCMGDGDEMTEDVEDLDLTPSPSAAPVRTTNARRGDPCSWGGE